MIEPVASLVMLACANTPLPAGGSQCGKMGRPGLKITNERRPRQRVLPTG
jgi:hypothetical protein